MMRIATGLAAVSLTAYLATSTSAAIYFSVAPFSPLVSPGGITPADVLVSTAAGVQVVIPGSSLGLQVAFDGTSYEGDDLNALSFGRDAIAGPLNFSVDHGSTGLPGTLIRGQVDENRGVAGDIFLPLPDSNSHALLIPAVDLGLTSLSTVGDDLNALSMAPPTQGVYFSIALFSASNFDGNLASTIFLNNLDTVFASAAHLGLDPEDDIDALLLWDVFEPGVLNPGIDIALFSISRDSLSASTMNGPYSPGDVLFTDFSGSSFVWASAASFGLQDTDDLNALSAVSAAIPEPGSCCCWVLAVGGMLARRRGRRGRVG